MGSKGFDPPDLEKFLESAFPDLAPAQLLARLSGGQSLFQPWRRPDPVLGVVPTVTRGFRIRLDLLHTKPPVWRRLEVSGDTTLPRLHEVIQAAMGWTDSHLHRFSTSGERNAPSFLTDFEASEGEEGLLEDGVRLDQLVASKGDRLWYEYDFGDGWEHLLRVEEVTELPPTAARCLTGRLACPPEDCGGVWGYQELAEWVRHDFDDALRPEVFDSAEEGRNWLPHQWHPDRFDLAETNALLAAITAETVLVGEELASLVEVTRRVGSFRLRELLADLASRESGEVNADAAAEATHAFRVLLDVVGDGVNLTNAGYLKPSDVEQIAQRAGITGWWIGKANREDLTWPVARLRVAARSLGLISPRKGRLTPTRAAQACAGDPQALLEHIVSRLPLGKRDDERQAGWMALVVAGSELPGELWDESISALLFDLGWREGRSGIGSPPADSPTLDVLRILAGAGQGLRRPRGVDPAVAAIARAAVRSGG